MATGFKSGGRRKGAKNKATLERERALQAAAAKALGSPGAFLGDAHSLLVSVYKNPHLPLEIRVEAARAALAYQKPRLAPIAAPEPPQALEERALKLHALLRQMRETIGSNGPAATMEGEA